MEDDDLIERIRWLNDRNGGNINLKYLADINDVYINLPENRELKIGFKLSNYYEKGWRWHQLVRVVLEPQENKQYMYDRLLYLILQHRKTYNSHFEIKIDENIFQIPNTLADLNKLEILYVQYLRIYKNIIDEVQFDHPRVENYGPNVRGKLNWTETLRRSRIKLPLEFSTSIMRKEFETPENILLILCAEWMCRESARLLNIKFPEQLSNYKINLLTEICRKTKFILDNFPIASVLNYSRKYWNLSYNDSRIGHLERETRRRINQMVVQNRNYLLLLTWIEEFKQLNLSNISEKTPNKHILEPIENLDTIFEIWIFMEFIQLLYEKGLLIDFQLDAEPNCKFEYNGKIVTLWYEKEFIHGSNYAWIQTHKPDFTAMIGNEIIAVFDAKNYSKSSSISDTKNKMLAYMTNLDANFGGLIYPYHPVNWDDLQNSERIEKLIGFMFNRNIGKDRNDIKHIAKNLAKYSWQELPSEYQELSPPLHMEKHSHPGPGKKSRYHHEQTICLFRMPPINSESALRFKKESLNKIFDEIVSRVPCKPDLKYLNP